MDEIKQELRELQTEINDVQMVLREIERRRFTIMEMVCELSDKKSEF